MNRKIIFLDIDGTLSIQNRVPPSAKRACRAARRNGHILYICTGRARLQVSQTITHIGFDGIISSGGAYIESSAAPCHTADGIPRPAAGKNGGGTLFEASIEREKLLTLTAYLEERRAAYMLELTDKLIGGPYLKSYFEKYYSGRPLTIKSLLERIFLRKVFKRCEPYNGSLECGNVRKVVFWERDGLTFEDIKREFGGGIEIFRLSIPVAGMSGGEIGPLGIHKGSALEKVAAYHGFELADTIAFGDSDNDRTMIQLAGLGVAMGNAEPSLKAEAGDVTDSVENDGLAKAFKKYGLI